MRRLVGVFLIVQVVLTYLILNALNRLSVFVTDRALAMGEEDGPIKIEHIHKLRTSKISFMALSPFSGPALSTELMEITYGKHDEIINISPINKKEFVKVLVAENTEIHDHTNI